MFECLHNLAPLYFHGYFTSIERIHNIGTRQSIRGDLFALRCNTTQYGLRSIHYSGIRLWNSLPLEIRNSNSLSIFRNKLKNIQQPINPELEKSDLSHVAKFDMFPVYNFTQFRCMCP